MTPTKSHTTVSFPCILFLKKCQILKTSIIEVVKCIPVPAGKIEKLGVRGYEEKT